MVSHDPAPADPIDELLDAFIAAWHAGRAPSPVATLAAATEDDREQLARLLAAFLELAPTVPRADGVSRPDDDGLLDQLADLERQPG